MSVPFRQPVRRVFVALSAAALGAAAAVALGWGGSAAEAGPNQFAISGSNVRALVANGHVFSSADGDSAVLVHNITGTLLATLPDEAGVTNISMAPDGSQVYLSLAAGQVSVIDTTTLSEVARYDVSAYGTPAVVVPAGDRLFVSTWDSTTYTVVAIDTSDPAAATPQYVTALAAQTASFTARADDAAGGDDVYVNTCSVGGTCGLTRYTWDGSTATQAADIGTDDSGHLYYDAADNVLLTTTASTGITKLDPVSLQTVGTVAGRLTAPNAFTHGRVVQATQDPDSGAQLVVRDLTGAVTYSADTSNPFAVLTDPASTDVYALIRTADNTSEFVDAFPYALLSPTAPNGPTGLTAAPVARGAISISWSGSSVDGNDAPTRYDVYRSTTEGVPETLITTVAPTVTEVSDSGGAAGSSYYYVVQAVNAVSSASVGTTAPVSPDAVAPQVKLAGPSAAVDTATTASVSYGATDSGSGVASYDVRYRAASAGRVLGGYAYPATWQATTSRARALNVAAGSEYCFSARARDFAGNVSGWTAERCTSSPIDDRSLHTSATRHTSSSYYLRTYSYATKKTTRFTLGGISARRVGILATTCTNCGQVQVTLGRRTLGRVNLHASSTHYRQTLWLPITPTTAGTLTVTTLSKSRVLLDGVVVQH